MADTRGDRGVPLKDAAHGAGGRGGEPARVSHLRAPFPAGRSILWTPRRDAGTPAAPATEGPYELFLGQAALAAAAAHVSTDDREGRFGFLLGAVFRCPDSGIHYAAVDRTLAGSEPFSEDAPGAYLLRAWADCQPAFRDHGGVLLGWYHSHYLLGLFLSEGDQETNRRYFSAPWQCSLLFVPDPERPLGAVFRPSEDGGGHVPDPAPFRELLVPGRLRGGAAAPSVVRWTNYEPDREVVAAEAPAEATARAEARERVMPEVERPAAASSITLVLPDDLSERRFPRVPRHRLRQLGMVAALVIVVLVAFRVLSALRGTGGGSSQPTPAVVSPEQRRFRQAAVEVDAAVARYAERSQDFDLGRIGCDLLSSGYSSADDAFVAMAGAFAALGAAPDSARISEYERLADDVNGVNRHFDGSGCQRPR